MSEVDDDQPAALRRLWAAFGPIEVVESSATTPATTWQRRRPIGARKGGR